MAEIPKSKTGTGYGKKRELPTVAITAVLLMFAAAVFAVYVLPWINGPSPITPGTGQAAGSNPLPQAAATQEKRSLPPLKELIAAGKLDTPQAIAEYMRNNFGYAETGSSRTVDEFLVYGGGVGGSNDFFFFFYKALAAQGCEWNVHTYTFVLANVSGGPKGYDPANPIVFFTDPRDGNNYYFITEYPDFRIVNIGKSADPTVYEEQRLNRTILRDYGYIVRKANC